MVASSPDQGAGAPSGPKRDVAGEFKKQPIAEKILGLAAVGFVLAFAVGNRWKALFAFGKEFYQPWMHTLGFVGALGVLVLVITKLLGIKLLEPKLYGRLLVLAAILPAAGMLIEELRNFWGFVLLAAIILMAYAGAKISTRDHILK